jgi:hypothetical protein
VVEGQSQATRLDDMAHRRVEVAEHVGSGQSKRRHPVKRQPGVALGVEVGLIAAVVMRTVDLNAELRLGTEEVEDELAHGMLLAELQAGGACAQGLPKQDFG